jgi:hypothetical protein
MKTKFFFSLKVRMYAHWLFRIYIPQMFDRYLLKVINFFNKMQNKINR